MIQVDSREKRWNHIKEYFDSNGIQYEVIAIKTGDYLNTENQAVVIDRKANLDEVANNLMRGKSNRIRFTKECKRAFDDRVRFIVLIEGTNCTCVKDITSWKSKYSAINGKWLANEMFTLSMAYNVEWMFCKKNQTAKKILELLGYGIL